MPHNTDGLERMVVRICPENRALFENMLRDGGFADEQDMLNTALTVLGWTIRHAQQKRAVAATDIAHGLAYELSMPFLEHAAGSLTITAEPG